MNAGLIGYMVGTIAASLVLPVILLVVLKLIPATKGKHAVNYGIAGSIAVITPWIALGDQMGLALVASLILAGIFYWQYKRLSAKAASQTSS